MDIKKYLKDKRKLIDDFLKWHFDSRVAHAPLINAMTYSVFAGGKRLRPILALASYEACGGIAEHVLQYAAALELIHTYSLIHDDLPAMDDDDLRRGKPTNHKVFGEGMAVLAGDALLTEAFFLLSQKSTSPVRIQGAVLLKLVRDVAMAAGAHGMVGGQAEDILSENKAADEEGLAFIHTHKTGALITASVRMGGILASVGRRRSLALTRYGENVGLAFQIVDDILDVQGETGELGKTVGSDEKKKKATYPALYGIDVSMKKAETLIHGAIEALKDFTKDADPLREIARYIIRRRN